VANELLHDFDILTIGLEDRRKSMAKGMPRSFLVDPQPPGVRVLRPQAKEYFTTDLRL